MLTNLPINIASNIDNSATKNTIDDIVTITNTGVETSGGSDIGIFLGEVFNSIQITVSDNTVIDSIHTTINSVYVLGFSETYYSYTGVVRGHIYNATTGSLLSSSTNTLTYTNESILDEAITLNFAQPVSAGSYYVGISATNDTTDTFASVRTQTGSANQTIYSANSFDTTNPTTSISPTPSPQSGLLYVQHTTTIDQIVNEDVFETSLTNI